MSLKKWILWSVVGFYIAGCASSSGPESPDDALLSQEFNEFSEGEFADPGIGAIDSNDDLFSDGSEAFGTNPGPSDEGFTDAPAANASNDDFSSDFDDDFGGEGSLDNEFADLGESQAPANSEFSDDLFAELDASEPAAATPTAPPAVSDDDFLSELDAEPVPTTPEPAPSIDQDIFADLDVESPPPATAAPAPQVESYIEPTPNLTVATTTITNIEYKASESGGTIVIGADQPLDFTTRNNSSLNQFVIEIPNATLPARLKRPYDTSEFDGSVGAIQAYQDPGSTTARVIIQLRDGVSAPQVQREGNSLLVFNPDLQSTAIAESSQPDTGANAFDDNNKILAAKSLEEFLNGNTKFYGKKISIETTEGMNIRDFFHLISEETGINLVIDDDVNGKVGLLKLRQVPWDQALQMISKVNKLGYTRQGNVLRIAKIADLRTEESEVRAMRESRRVIEPLKVQMIPISYAKMDDIAKQVKEFLTERGKVVGDNRTSSLLVTDISENIEKVKKLVASLDIAPPQVLIEGKIVEATNDFAKRLGVNWALNGTTLGGNGGPAFKSGIQSSPSLDPGNLAFDFSLGTFPNIGDLTSRLRLSERQDEAKIISSPRIVTLHNETAQIKQTQQIPIISVDENNRKTVVFKPVNLQLDVVPQITSDQSVILAVDVLREFAGATVDTETQARAINSRSAKTKVLVHNGDTAVIGGIYQNDSTESVNGVPGLKDLPFIGALFRTTTTEKSRTELLIFLTPRVLGDAGDAAMSSSFN